MHCSSYLLYEPEPEPEPEFSNFDETYYLTSFDSSYSSVGPYGEPLQYHEEELLDESHFFSLHQETEDGFLSGAWYSNEQDYDEIDSPYNGNSTWLDVDAYESYFASFWGEGLVPHGYSYSGYDHQPDSGSLEKADNAYLDGAWDTFNQHMQLPSYNDNQSGFEFDYGSYENDDDDDDDDHFSKTPQPAHDNLWIETRLWESILGHWPRLVPLDQESHPTQLSY